MKLLRLNGMFLAISLLVTTFVPQAQALAFGTQTVSGRVTDANQKPVKNAHVDLWEKEGDLFATTTTNRRGEFVIDHEPCGICFMEVTAPAKTGLAQAILENVQGRESRSYVVSLKKGFLVKGRVTSAGKGLKGVIVKVFSQDHKENKQARTHGGGAIRTGSGGKFRIVLTPGDKMVVLLNSRYKDVTPRKEAQLKVVRDVTLADINMPRL
ncbi:MAG: carboxypeptidase-like regulatory domain-containing protein [Candidatus Obscuribacterales bacterium]|nr:carboxypeptidase-like regulatory domain-containing protein [Candidatus Obscuribacterales bacterium]